MKITMTTAMIIGRLFVDRGDFACFVLEAFIDFDFVLIGFLLIVNLRYFSVKLSLKPASSNLAYDTLIL